MSDRYKKIRLSNQLCFPLYLCAKEVVNEYTKILQPFDLTYTQYVVMMYLWEQEKASAKNISDTLLLDPSTLTPILKKLCAKGLITKARSEEDERSIVIGLTQKGDALKDKVLRVPDAIKQKLGLSDGEAETLCRLLYKALINIERNK